jgi:photosystem II stability/assembly factor-like uncharacterized protein
MLPILRLRWAALILIFALLSACGKFEVYVEIRPTRPTKPAQSTQLSTIHGTVTPQNRSSTSAPDSTSTSPANVQTATNVLATSTPVQTEEAHGLNPATPISITSIHMLDASQGWAVGQVDTDLNDRILFTRDGGQHWQDRTPYAALSAAPPEGLSAITAFGSAQQAWVVYASLSPQTSQSQAYVWITTDGGISWQQSAVLDFAGAEQEFFRPGILGFLPDLQHGWLLVHLGTQMNHDDVAIFTTSDAGHTWQRTIDPQSDPELMACSKSALVFSTDRIAWLAGNCPGLMPTLFLYRSTDGGRTWTQMSPPPPVGQPGDFFSSGRFACGIPGWVYSASRDLMFLLRCDDFPQDLTLSWLYSSHDSGLTWEVNPLPVPYGSLSFPSRGEGWLLGAFGSNPTANQELYHSVNSGRSWDPVIPVGWQGIPDFVTSTKGWVAAQSNGDRALVRTEDGGETWQVINPIIGP